MAKAASYMRNVGKSLGYSLINEIKNSNPAIASFSSNNSEAIRATYNAIAHMDKTVQSVASKILDSKAGELGKYALQNIKEDLKSGKFYNLERQKEASDEAVKSLMGDDGFDDDFGFEDLANGSDDFSFDDEESLESMVDLVGKKSSEAVSDAVIRTTEYSVGVQTQLARASAEQNKAMYANLHSALGTINENVSKLIELGTGPLTTHMENSQKFYENETKLSEERNSLLKELVEMQKGVYNKQKKENSKNLGVTDIIDENGMVEIESYFEIIKKNLNSLSMGTGDIVKEMLEGDMLKDVFASPLKAITDRVAKVLIPGVLKNTMKDFNKTLSGAFATGMARMMNSDSDNGIFNWIKDIFGIKDNTKTSISPSKYEKGSIPFDGITKKSIVEVIPTYLARIEAALTKGPERRYDYEEGKFLGIDDIKKSVELNKKISRDIANMDVIEYIDRYLSAINFGDNKEREKQLKANIDKILKQSYDRGYLFNKGDFAKSAGRLGLDGKNASGDLRIIEQMFASLPREVVTQYARNVYDAKNMYSRSMQRKEEGGYDITNALYNNSLTDYVIPPKTTQQTTQTTQVQKIYRGEREKGKDRAKRNQSKSNKSSSKTSSSSSDDDSDPLASFGYVNKDWVKKNPEEAKAVEKKFGTGGLNKIIKQNENKSTTEAIAEDLKKNTIAIDDAEGLSEEVAAAFIAMNDKDKKTKKGLLERIKDSEKASEGIKKLVRGIETLVKKPTDFLAGIIKKADASLYNLIFGEELDENGEKKSIAKAIFDGLQKTFKDFKEWSHKYIFDPIKKYFDKEGTLGNKAKKFVSGKVKQFRESDFGQRMKGTFKGAGNWAKDTVSNTASDALKAVYGESAEDGLINEFKANIGTKADGAKRVKKTGLAVISEGEMIIPPDMNPYNIDRRYKNESKVRDNFLSTFIPTFAEGNMPSWAAGYNQQTKGGVYVKSGTNTNTDTPKKKEPTDAEVAKKWNELWENDKEACKAAINNLPIDEKIRVYNILRKNRFGDLAGTLLDDSVGALIGGAKAVVDRGKEVLGGLRSGDEKKSGDGPNENDWKIMAKNAFFEIKKFAPEIAAGAIIGGGVSLLTGAIGGPLVGAAVGGGISLLKHSDTMMNTLFGEIGEDGKRQGSKFISKETSQAIEKYAPSMAKGGLLGAISSLVLPFGPVPGIIIGTAIGYAKQNENVMTSLFGDDFGDKTKDFTDKVKKNLPAMGAGALVGAIAGPFGLVPNMVLGSVAGLAMTTDKFKNFMFGEEDENGKRHGGLIETAVTNLFKPLTDFTKNTIDNLTKWADENIKKPLVEAIDPLKQQVKLVFEGIHKGINKLFEESLGASMDKLLEQYIFKPVTGFIKKVTGFALAPIKMAVSAPFKLIGAVGNSLRNRQVKRGNAEYMSADQRLAFRERRGKLRNMNVTERSRRWQSYDEALSDMSGDEASDLASSLSFALDQEKALKDSRNSAYNVYDKAVRKNKKLSASQVNSIAKPIKDFVEKGKGDPEKVSKDAHKAIAKLKGLSDAEKKQLANAVDEFLGSVQESNSRAAEFGNNKKKLMEALENSETFKEHGVSIEEEDLPKLLKYLKAEAEFKTVKDDGSPEHPDAVAGDIPTLNDEQQKRHEETINILDEINQNLVELTHPDKSKAKENAEKMGETYDEDKAKVDNSIIRNLRHDAAEGIKDILEIVKDVVKSAAYGATHNKTVGDNTIDFLNLNKGKKSTITDKDGNILSSNGIAGVENAAAGMKRVTSTGLIAVSGGEMIIPPDLNPFNINKRKRGEDKAKELFAESIPGFAQGALKVDVNSESINNPSLFDAIKEISLNSDLNSNLNSVGGNKEKKREVRYEFSEGRPFKFVSDDDGEMQLDKSDSDTVNSLNEVEEERKEKKGLVKSLTDLPTTLFGGIKKLFGGETSEEDEKKGILSRLVDGIKGVFGFATSSTGGSIATAAIGAPLLVGALDTFFNETEVGKGIKESITGFVDNLGLKEKLESLGDKIIGWFAGEPGSLGGGFPGLVQALAGTWGKGFEVLCNDALPFLIETFVTALPNMVKGLLRGLKNLLGMTVGWIKSAFFGDSSSESAMDDGDIMNGDGSPVEKTNSWTFGGSTVFNGIDLAANLTSSGTGTITVPGADDYFTGGDSVINTLTGAHDELVQSAEQVVKNAQEQNAANGVTKSNEEVAQEIAESSRSGYQARIKEGDSVKLEDTDMYQSMPTYMKEELEKNYSELENQNKDFISFTDDGGTEQIIPKEEFLTNDEKFITVYDENGQPKLLSPQDLLDPHNANHAKQFGIDYTLSKEEKRQRTEDLGMSRDMTLAENLAMYIGKKGLKGKTTSGGMKAFAKMVGKLPGGGFINKPLEAAAGLSSAAGRFGNFVMRGGKTAGKAAEEAGMHLVTDRQLSKGINGTLEGRKGANSLRHKMANGWDKLTGKYQILDDDTYQELMRMEEAGELKNKRKGFGLFKDKNNYNGKRNVRQARRNVKDTNKAAKEGFEEAAEKAGKTTTADAAKEATKETGEKAATKATKETSEKAATKAAKEGFEEASEKATKEGFEAAAEKAGKTAASKAAKEGLEEAGEKAVKEGLEEVGETLLEKESSGVVKKIIDWAKDMVKKFCESNTVVKYVKKTLERVGKEASEKAAKGIIGKIKDILLNNVVTTFAKNLAKKAKSAILKISSKLFVPVAGVIISIATGVAAFVDGYNNAASNFGLIEGEKDVMEPTFPMKLISGCVSCATEFITQGLVPASTIIGFFIPILDLFGVDMSEIQEAQKKSDEILAEYNLTNDDGVELSIEEYNRKDDLSTKLMNGARDLGGKAVNALKDAGGWVADKAGGLWDKITGKDDKDDKDDKDKNKSSSKVSSSAGTAASKISSIADVVKTSITNTAKTNSADTLKDSINSSIAEASNNLESSINMSSYGLNNATVAMANEAQLNADESISYIDETIAGVGATALTPLSSMQEASESTSAFIRNFASQGNNIFSKIQQDQNNINKYFDKDGIDSKYWNVSSRSYGKNSYYSSLYESVAMTNRLMNAPVLMMAASLKANNKNIQKVVDNAKDELDTDSTATAANNARSVSSTASTGATTAISTAANAIVEAAASGSKIYSFSGRGNATSGANKPKSDSKYAANSAFVSQIDPSYANQPFNAKGDTEKQTIGDTGCGPAAAAMVVNNAYQNNNVLDMKQASKDALGYKVKNGGVNAAYFGDEFKRHGLATKYIVEGSKKDRSADIRSELRSGNRVVLMGQDATNKSKVTSPYGPDDHYIVATRISDDGKYIWVNDPESKVPEVKYPADRILSKSKMGVAGVAASGSRLLKSIAARGSSISKIKNKLKRYVGRGAYGPDTPQYKTWNALRSAGYTENATAAAMGNINNESGFDPSAIENGSGIGFGLIQWSKGRRTALEEYAASKGVSASNLDLQLEYLIKELNNETNQWMKGSTSYGFGTLTRDDWVNGDLDTATKAFMCCFERPAYDSSINHIDRRLNDARKFFEEFTGTEPTGTSAISGDGEDSSSGSNDILSEIFGVFDDLAVAYGLKSKSSDSGSSTSGGSVGNASSLQEALVEKMKSVEGTLDYSQAQRDPNGGSADCSSTVQWAYKNVLGVDPGSWTGAQESDEDTYTVTTDFDESQMQPGDEILYNGHVEMYAGDGQMIGHGGPGKGPTMKKLSDQNRFRMIRRWKGFRDGFDKESIPEQYRNLAGSGSGLLKRIHARGNQAIDPKKGIVINDTTRSPIQKDNNKDGFLKKSKYNSTLIKDLELPAGLAAAGSDLDNMIAEVYNTVDAKAPVNIPKSPKSGNRSNDKLSAYLGAILKLLSKEVENTAMLSTIITILTELVKISEEERNLKGTSNDTEQMRQNLNTRRMAMMNVLNSTGIGSSDNKEISKLVKDAERLARI